MSRAFKTVPKRPIEQMQSRPRVNAHSRPGAYLPEALTAGIGSILRNNSAEQQRQLEAMGDQ